MYIFVKPFRCKTPTSTMDPFTCSTCQFSTTKKGNWERHLLTKKHKEKEKQCSCGKNFETRAGHWKHSQQCLRPLLETQHAMIQTLLEKQDQVQDQVKELQKMSPSIHISIFLNETCKEAMNWGDFIQQLELSDNQTVVDTIQQQLKQLGYKRPVHVLPTQMLYIKQQNQWNHDAPSIQNAITVLNEHIHQSQHKSLQSWEKEHPTWYLNEQETDMYTNFSNDKSIDESMLMVLVPKHTL